VLPATLAALLLTVGVVLLGRCARSKRILA